MMCRPLCGGFSRLSAPVCDFAVQVHTSCRLTARRPTTIPDGVSSIYRTLSKVFDPARTCPSAGRWTGRCFCRGLPKKEGAPPDVRSTEWGERERKGARRFLIGRFFFEGNFHCAENSKVDRGHFSGKLEKFKSAVID